MAKANNWDKSSFYKFSKMLLVGTICAGFGYLPGLAIGALFETIGVNPFVVLGIREQDDINWFYLV